MVIKTMAEQGIWGRQATDEECAALQRYVEWWEATAEDRKRRDREILLKILNDWKLT